MKFFEHITDKVELIESYKVLGFTILEKATVRYRRHPNSNMALSKVYKRLFGRVVYKAKYYNINGLFKKDLSLFSIPIFEKLNLNGYRLLFVLGIKVYSKPLKFLTDFKSECVDGLDKNYDDIYIVLHHVGDAFRTFTMIKSIIQVKQSKNPLIMVFDDSFVDLMKMMRLEIPYIKIQTSKPFKKRMESQFSTDEFYLGGFRFLLLWSRYFHYSKILPLVYSLPSDTHILSIYAAANNVTYDNNSMGKLEAIPEAEISMLKKSKHAGLNLDNFVFVAPEAYAHEMFYEGFWEKLIKALQNIGYDVFLNTVACKGILQQGSYTKDDKSKMFNLDKMQNIKSFYLTIAEAFALACRAKKIISHRSGLSELLVQTDVPMCVIYSGNNRNAVEQFKIKNVLTNSPFANPDKINEINVVGMDFDDIMRAISDMLSIKLSTKI